MQGEAAKRRAAERGSSEVKGGRTRGRGAEEGVQSSDSSDVIGGEQCHE